MLYIYIYIAPKYSLLSAELASNELKRESIPMDKPDARDTDARREGLGALDCVRAGLAVTRLPDAVGGLPDNIGNSTVRSRTPPLPPMLLGTFQ